ncbi:ABC transporter ATP-binding protein [Gilvimarinus agarilyticus]|uniref:ABC transporter ATP-binding protein n=1 Tax=Gilvimarinus sp. 2_MG-2023 TaxID=3062666 RepID=UPI001C099FEC|nr:ABC transporter ATP-binding protein [Gilvimarinus sp. 2_MG-2023]MBU2885717.1 ABC transporter ATP-binding protein [Gilvimarinus agarilyticus]MDO6570577.1 ABC transporter ATP-binding protein [Gilvimarinus sp. 2_MG-2023]
MLTLESVTFGYRKRTTCIDDLSLSLQAGQTLGLLGPNGAGKTTLVALVTGQRKPTSGKILFEGQAVELGHPGIALVPQEYAFYERLTARENLMFFAGLLGLARDIQKTRVTQALSQTELTHCADQKAGTYSGGLKRRLNFAIALLQTPKLLIMDEPTANVDPQSRAFLLDTIAQVKQQGTAIIYTSHLLSEVEAIADHVALLHQGKILLEGELATLLTEDHRHLEVQLSEPISEHCQSQFTLEALENLWYRCDLRSQSAPPGALLAALEADGAHIRQLRYGQHRLEELYLRALAETEGKP